MCRLFRRVRAVRKHESRVLSIRIPGLGAGHGGVVMTVRRVMLYVQHLLGIGHLKRCATLADAMSRNGIEVTLVSGGFDVPGIVINAARVVQLPPAGAADQSFSAIVDARGDPIDERWKQERRELLLDAWRAAAPHALVIELFPFGRRQMRFELIPLLDAACGAARRPVIACSVRDVLGAGQKNPARQDQMLELFERYFDHLLVHGDPSLIPFERTFQHAGRIGAKLHYTGYVVGRAPAAGSLEPVGDNEVIVSVGGGAVGRQLLETAMRARALTVFANRTWRLLAGVNIAAADLAALVAAARATGDGGIVVERNRADFAQLLANCLLSVSQGGYNTIVETLHAGTPCVVVPFAGGAETEQSLRTRLLADRGWIEVLEESASSPMALADAINRVAYRRRSPVGAMNLDGAQNTSALLSKWMAELDW